MSQSLKALKVSAIAATLLLIAWTQPAAGTQLWTDFSEYMQLQPPSAPGDWTEAGTGASTWGIIADLDATGDSLLRLEDSTSVFRALLWDEIDNDDVELVARVRASSTPNAGLSLDLRTQAGSSNSGYKAAIWGGSANFQINRWDEDSSTTLGSASWTSIGFSNPGSDYYWIRFRIEEDALKARVWNDGEDEPEVWHLETTDETYTSGGAGVGGWNSAGTKFFDVVGVGLGGAEAPTEEPEDPGEPDPGDPDPGEPLEGVIGDILDKLIGAPPEGSSNVQYVAGLMLAVYIIVFTLRLLTGRASRSHHERR